VILPKGKIVAAQLVRMTKEELRELRGRRGWTLKEWADRVGVDEGTVSKWETGGLRVSPKADLFFAREEIARLHEENAGLRQELAKAQDDIDYIRATTVPRDRNHALERKLLDARDAAYNALLRAASRDDRIRDLAKQLNDVWKDYLRQYTTSSGDKEHPWRDVAKGAGKAATS
jgi:transcriptional regulator with XRE-family HTH domain